MCAVQRGVTLCSVSVLVVCLYLCVVLAVYNTLEGVELTVF